MFLKQKPSLHYGGLWLLPKIGLFALQWRKTQDIAQGVGPACSKETDWLELCSPLQAITGASMLLVIFYSVEVVPVQSFDHRYTIVDLETKLYQIFSFPDHLQSDNGVLCLQRLPNNEPIVKIFDDIPHRLPSTGIWYCQAMNSLLKWSDSISLWVRTPK